MRSAPGGLRATGRLLAVLASGLLVGACPGERAKTGPISVRNPDYLVVRPIRREPDAEHTERVELLIPGGMDLRPPWRCSI